MVKMFRVLITAILIQLLLGPVAFSSDDLTPVVETNNGKVVGKVTTILNKKVNVFRGIPFAAPPVGTLRFKKPTLVENWEGTLEAFENKPACIQIKEDRFMKERNMDLNVLVGNKKPVGGAVGLAFELRDLKDSEDCLYMNIYVPGELSSNAKKAVVLILHGGLFYSGGAGISSIDGSTFASIGDVIVVIPQYRLGVFGFLHAGIPEIPGNLGLYDQRMAMVWLKNNIQLFGGNPKNVVLLGFDAGGWSAGFHLISTESQPLFKRAIMQSGTSVTPIVLFGEVTAISRFEKFINLTQCPLLSNHNKKDQAAVDATLKCLQELSVDDILQAQLQILMTKRDIGFVPSEDKMFFKGNPFDLVKMGKFGNIKEVLMGTNSNDGGLMLATALRSIYPPIGIEPKPVNLNDLVESVKKNSASSNVGQLQMILPMFFRGVDKKDPLAVRKRLLSLAKDGIFLCPDLLFITSFVKNGGEVYYYNFDLRPSSSPYSKWLEGGQHMDEVQYIFGMPLRSEYESHYTTEEKKISELMIKVWTHYAKSGNTKTENVKWKPTINKDRYYVLINKKGFKNIKGFPKNLCKDLSKYYPMGQSFLRTYKP